LFDIEVFLGFGENQSVAAVVRRVLRFLENERIGLGEVSGVPDIYL
jgi:hypothetical protein